jgi:RNA polymerase sigma factor (sigma-70 family)
MRPHFETIISKHQSSAFKMLCHLTKDRSLSQDLLQETLLRAYYCEKSIDDNKYRNWLLTIAKNVVIDHNRKKARLKKSKINITEIYFSLGLDNFGYSYDSLQMEDTEQYEFVSYLIKQKFECCFLHKFEKIILRYCYLKGFSYAKSAKILHCSPVTVRLNYLSAIDKIKRHS